MIRALALLAALLAGSCATVPRPRAEWSLAIHGGAGVIERAQMDAATEAAYRAAMNAALDRGSAVLARGGSSLDAVEAVITGM